MQVFLRTRHIDRQPRLGEVAAMVDALPVLYRDEHLMVLHKPSGLLMHRGWGNDSVTVVDLVRTLVGTDTVHPIQRLDRGASGAVIIALTVEAARRLNLTQSEGGIHKQYLTLVRGTPAASGIIDHPIPRKEGGPRVAATTEFACRETVDCEPRSVSLVSAWPRTGRLHQVRRHLKHLGHPLIGDVNYGRGELNRAFRDVYGLHRLALHAFEIQFEHPMTAAGVHCVARVPDDLAIPMRRIGFAEASWQSTELLAGAD